MGSGLEKKINFESWPWQRALTFKPSGTCSTPVSKPSTKASKHWVTTSFSTRPGDTFPHAQPTLVRACEHPSTSTFHPSQPNKPAKLTSKPPHTTSTFEEPEEKQPPLKEFGGMIFPTRPDWDQTALNRLRRWSMASKLFLNTSLLLTISSRHRNWLWKSLWHSLNLLTTNMTRLVKKNLF